MIDAGKTMQELMEKRGKTKIGYAQELGMSRQLLHQYMTRNPDTIKLNIFQAFLDGLGYEIVIREKPQD